MTFRFYLSDVSKSLTVNKFYSVCEEIIGGDAVSGSYYIDSISNNLIQLTSLDTIGKQISGTFSIKLIKDKSYPVKTEIVQFKEGQFKLSYKEGEY